MEAQSRINLEFDYRVFPHGAVVLDAVSKIGGSGRANEYTYVVNVTNLAPGAKTTQRIVNGQANVIFFWAGIGGTVQTTHNRKAHITIEDGTLGRKYADGIILGTLLAEMGTNAPFAIPIVIPKGRALDVTVFNNDGSLTFSDLEIVFRGLSF